MPTYKISKLKFEKYDIPFTDVLEVDNYYFACSSNGLIVRFKKNTSGEYEHTVIFQNKNVVFSEMDYQYPYIYCTPTNAGIDYIIRLKDIFDIKVKSEKIQYDPRDYAFKGKAFFENRLFTYQRDNGEMCTINTLDHFKIGSSCVYNNDFYIFGVAALVEYNTETRKYKVNESKLTRIFVGRIVGITLKIYYINLRIVNYFISEAQEVKKIGVFNDYINIAYVEFLNNVVNKTKDKFECAIRILRFRTNTLNEANQCYDITQSEHKGDINIDVHASREDLIFNTIEFISENALMMYDNINAIVNADNTITYDKSVSNHYIKFYRYNNSANFSYERYILTNTLTYTDDVLIKNRLMSFTDNSNNKIYELETNTNNHYDFNETSIDYTTSGMSPNSYKVIGDTIVVMYNDNVTIPYDYPSLESRVETLINIYEEKKENEYENAEKKDENANITEEIKSEAFDVTLEKLVRMEYNNKLIYRSFGINSQSNIDYIFGHRTYERLMKNQGFNRKVRYEGAYDIYKNNEE